MAQLPKSTRLLSDIVPMNVDDVNDKADSDDDILMKTPRKNLLPQFTDTQIDIGNGRMKVYLRIRPLTKTEIDKQENQKCLEVESAQTVLAHAPKDSHSYRNTAHGLGKTTNKFTFSRIFKEDTSQKEFFKDTMLSSVKDFIDGQNCLVFSYGVTSSGKTYTIQGNPSDAGVLPRALDVLFNSISGKQWGHMNLKPTMFTDVIRLTEDEELREKKLKEKILRLSHEDDVDVMSLLGEDASDISQMANTTTSSESSNVSSIHYDSKSSVNTEEIFLDLKNRVREETAVSVEDQGQIRFSVWVSFAEIYNEQIFDLLEAVPRTKKARRNVLKLSEDKNGSPYVKGLKQIHVESADEAYKLLVIGQRNLRTACTKLNHNSSRSHCIYNIKVLRVVDKGAPHVARVSMLSFCDLAGSERYSKTQNSGERLREAGNINTSLMTLGRCIETLRYNQTHKENKIIPFRDSKLTRLFQNFFNGTGRAAMIINISQSSSLFDETIHVLKFSAIATKIIVTQKAEPPPKFHISSLSGPDDARPSISWATPCTLAKSHFDMESAINMPLPEDDDEDLNESDDGVNSLLQLIEDLKQELIREKRSKVMLEAKIREEVCQEMMKQFVEIENNYSERIRFTEQRAEDMADRRIQIYLDAVSGDSHSKKQPEHVEDDDDEYVSSILLHQEQAKVEALETKTKDLEAEIAELKSKLTDQNKEKSTMKVNISQLEQQQMDHSANHDAELDQLKKQLAEAESTIQKLQSQIHKKADNTTDYHMEKSSLTEKLKEAREQINSQQAEIKELNEMLTEAGETFENKETEISKLKELCQDFEDKLKSQAQTIKALEAAAEKSRNAMETADYSLSKREESLAKLKDELQQLKGTPPMQGAVIPDTPPLSEEPGQNQPQSHQTKSVCIAKESLDRGSIDSGAVPDTTGYATDSDDEIIFKTRFTKDPQAGSVLCRNQVNKAMSSKKSFTVYHDIQREYIIPSIQENTERSQTPKTPYSVSSGTGSHAKKSLEDFQVDLKYPKEKLRPYIIKKPLDNSRVLQVVLTPLNNKHVTHHTKTSLLRLKNSPRQDPTRGRECISKCSISRPQEKNTDMFLSVGKRKALEDLNTSKRRKIESVPVKKAPIRKSLGKKYNLRSRR
ncbi:hypothetical protein ACJMK2_007900 [Sinanodonta woodiana]|uniref:Kinesin motor domain-containing protein n=1 Tax=Sinanodonta woodiana TaxID=1069815 RepID=A0ABD3VKV3_SINWO